MKSSHSGTPIFSPAGAVVAVVLAAVADLFEFSATLLLLLVVSVFPQLMRTAAHRIQKAKRDLGSIRFSPSEFSGYDLNQSFVRMEKRADDTRCTENLIACANANSRFHPEF